MKIEVKIEDKEIREQFDAILNNLGNTKKIMNEIGNRLLSDWELSWKKQQNPYGVKWADLSETTKAIKNQEKYQILVGRSNMLLGSYRVEAFADHVEIGTNVIYARTHQFGAKKGEFGRTKRGAPIPWGDIPARKMLPDKGLPVGAWDEIKEILSKRLFEV